MSKPRFDIAAVVLGMHRSGTSALAGVLKLQGFATPQTVLPASPANERGFWESERINALNDGLFADLGSSWHGVDALALGGLGSRRLRSAHKEIEATLAGEFEEGARPLIKDPRLCRLLPLWQPLLSKLCRQIVYPIVVRNPVEVARSLAERNDFDLDLGYLLWARYYLDAEYYTRNSPRVLVTYDGLMRDWRATRDAIAALGVELVWDSVADAAVDEYLSETLRHHRTADDQGLLELAHLPVVQQTYRTFLNWRRSSPTANPDCALLDEAREQFNQLGGMLSRVVENARLDRKRLATSKSRAASMAADLERAHRAKDELSHVRASLEKQFGAHAKLEARLEAIANSVPKAIQERSKFERLLAEANQKAEQAATEIRQARAEAGRERALLEQRLAEAKSEAEHSQKIRDRLLTEIDQLKGDIDAHARERAQLGAQHDQQVGLLTAERGQLAVELKDVKRKYRSTQHQLTRDREKLRKMQARLAGVEADLARIQASTVWRGYQTARSAVRRCEMLLRRMFGRSERKVQAFKASLIRSSQLFDGDWYIVRYPDVAAAGIDPAVHYLESGWKEGRDPSQSFSTASYLNLNSDVAAAGINPLVHFIEFGYSEGRQLAELPSAPTRPAAAPQDDFGPANACASFPIERTAPVRWRRRARLNEAGGNLLIYGGEPVGLVSEGPLRSELQDAFEELARMSGCAEAGSRRQALICNSGTCSLLDVWFVNTCLLRTRWAADGPLVVRAYQCNATDNGQVLLVGEGLVVSSVDWIDLALKNPFFPLLFVISDADGTVRGFEFLALPSLCRGGVHYPELLAADRTDGAKPGSLDFATISATLHQRLRAITDGAAPFVGRIAVNVAGADGTETLFNRDFQTWLSNVMQVGVDVLDADASEPISKYLSDAIKVEQDARETGITLILSADMVPTIGALVMATRERAGDDRIELPVLVASNDPAQPFTLIELPCTVSELANQGRYSSDLWPRFDSANGTIAADQLSACAIRYPKRLVLTDSELLVPVAKPVLPLPEISPQISWLVFPEDWEEDALFEGLRALSLQTAAVLVMVGEVQPSSNSFARSLFHQRLHRFPDVPAAIQGIATPLTGYLGPHLILHDERTSGVLAKMIDDPAVVSASCVLLSSDKRGKGWQISVVDPGNFQAIGQDDRTLAQRCHDAQLFWRSTYPVLQPPRDLWLARSASVAGWLERAGPLRAEEGVQLCTSLVTATYVRPRDQSEPHLRPPASARLQAIRSEALFG